MRTQLARYTVQHYWAKGKLIHGKYFDYYYPSEYYGWFLAVLDGNSVTMEWEKR